mmetsp:Transcript_43694/g.115441  ORF Transcript_43694/g.115441 Transcript_43694/m.115441 type:complete len:254 (+) Transcript_43694:263-1024(+)
MLWRAELMDFPQRSELFLGEFHELDKLADEPLMVAPHQRQIHVSRTTSQLQHTSDELVDIDVVGSICVHQLEQRPRVVRVNIQSSQVSLDRHVEHVTLQLSKSKALFLGCVHISKEFFDVLDMLLSVGAQGLSNNCGVAHGGLNGAVAENTRDDVQYSKVGEGHVANEQPDEKPADVTHGPNRLVPTDPSRDGLKQREHGVRQRFPISVHVLVRNLRVPVVSRRALHEADAEHVNNDEQQHQRPDQGLHREHD